MQFLIYIKWPVVFTVIIQQSARMKRSKSTWWKTSSFCTHINQLISVQVRVFKCQTMFSSLSTKKKGGKKTGEPDGGSSTSNTQAISQNHSQRLNKDTESLEMFFCFFFGSDIERKKKKEEQPTSHISYPDWEAMAPTTETLEGGGRRAQGISQRFTSFLVITRQPKVLPPPETTQPFLSI